MKNKQYIQDRFSSCFYHPVGGKKFHDSILLLHPVWCRSHNNWKKTVIFAVAPCVVPQQHRTIR